MIELHNLNKTYADKVALEIEAISIGPGESIGLVGNNGAGKTTMLSLILDLIRPTKGFVTSQGIKVSETDKWKGYTGSYLDENFLIPFLKPVEYLEFVGKLNGLSKADILEFLTKNKLFFNEELVGSNKLIRDLSKGNKNKLGILGAFMCNPKILILDEPFANLDPTSQEWLKMKLKSLNEEGMTLFVSSHNINHVTEISTRILLLEVGLIEKDVENTASTFSELEDYFKIGVG